MKVEQILRSLGIFIIRPRKNEMSAIRKNSNHHEELFKSLLAEKVPTQEPPSLPQDQEHREAGMILHMSCSIPCCKLAGKTQS